jgi:hypothetical protein
LGSIRLCAQQELDVADRDRGARLDRGLGHGGAAHTRVVGGAEVAHDDAARAALEHAVVSRNSVVGEHEIVVGGLADRDTLAELHAAAACGTGYDQQHQLVGNGRNAPVRASRGLYGL